MSQLYQEETLTKRYMIQPPGATWTHKTSESTNESYLNPFLD